MDVLVPLRVGEHERSTFIERLVKAELAKVGEWPILFDYESGSAVQGRADVVCYSVTFTSGAYRDLFG